MTTHLRNSVFGVATAALLFGGGTAIALAGTADGAPEQQAPSVVHLGEDCTTGAPAAHTDDGASAYCAQVRGTQTAIWSSTPDPVPNDPRTPPRPADDCFGIDDETTGVNGEPLYCNPTVNGRDPGNLLWQLVP
ncbi:hypothetical protein [Nocardia callitridis]